MKYFDGRAMELGEWRLRAVAVRIECILSLNDKVTLQRLRFAQRRGLPSLSRNGEGNRRNYRRAICARATVRLRELLELIPLPGNSFRGLQDAIFHKF